MSAQSWKILFFENTSNSEGKSEEKANQENTKITQATLALKTKIKIKILQRSKEIGEHAVYT